MKFVDVDGTLIDADDKPQAFVVAAVWLCLARQEHVVIWTGGGEDYAQTIGRRLFPGYERQLSFLAKDTKALRAGDVVVDDSLEFKVPEGAFLKTPDEFAEWMLA